eukprot:SAG25_NODE_411_length_8395_cov_6.454556_13_plen_73_part_00
MLAGVSVVCHLLTRWPHVAASHTVPDLSPGRQCRPEAAGACLTHEGGLGTSAGAPRGVLAAGGSARTASMRA